MGHWGWRPLLNTLFICVLVTGCNISSGTAPALSPTNLPLVTLTLRIRPSPTPSVPPITPVTETINPVPTAQSTPTTDSTYVVRPGDTLLGIALDFGLGVSELRAANVGIDPLALQVGQIISIPPPSLASAALPTPLPIVLDPPACEFMITGRLLCLGQVHNPYDRPLRNVRVGLTLLAADETPLQQITTGVEQMLIPPQSSAPYSVILPGQEYDRVVVNLLAADKVDAPLSVPTLDIVREQVQAQDNRYQVTVTLRNSTAQTIKSARLILTVVDDEQRVVGLRIIDSPTGFEPGAEQTLTVEALTRAADGPLQHTLYIEGR